MKRFVPLHFFILALLVNSLAQSPASVPYQAVARTSAGNLISNQPICVQFTVHQLTPTGTTEYQEHQTTTTNKLGLFNRLDGNGGHFWQQWL